MYCRVRVRVFRQKIQRSYISVEAHAWSLLWKTSSVIFCGQFGIYFHSFWFDFKSSYFALIIQEDDNFVLGGNNKREYWMLMKEYFLYCIQDGSFVFLPMKQIHMHTNKTVSTMKFGEIPHRLVDGTSKKPNRHTYINRLIQHLSKGLIFHKNTVFSCQLVREAGGAKKPRTLCPGCYITLHFSTKTSPGLALSHWWHTVHRKPWSHWGFATVMVILNITTVLEMCTLMHTLIPKIAVIFD